VALRKWRYIRIVHKTANVHKVFT